MEAVAFLLFGAAVIGFIMYETRRKDKVNAGLKHLKRTWGYEYWFKDDMLYRCDGQWPERYILGEWTEIHHWHSDTLSLKKAGFKRITIEEADKFVGNNTYDEWQTYDEQKA